MGLLVESHRRRAVNKELWTLTYNRYHDGLPLQAIDEILTCNGFNMLEEAIYCGREGKVHEHVGGNTWFTMTWHKMEVTGRYEVVAYVS
jgi:hypothetical protein